jgi:iron-sulfur cluster repair protein YtfE (RIC family)
LQACAGKHGARAAMAKESASRRTYAVEDGPKIWLRAALGGPDRHGGVRLVRAEARGADPESLGTSIAEELLDRGGAPLLEAAQSEASGLPAPKRDASPQRGARLRFMTKRAGMNPTDEQRRQILRGQHTHLRETIQAAQTAARNLRAERAVVGELQAAVIALKNELLAHLADEERLLEPVLANLDAWGPVRAGLFRAEHAHQRAVLAVLTGPTAWPAAPLVAGRTLSLCEDLLTDMEFEERELLNEKVLRDDFVLLGASDA